MNEDDGIIAFQLWDSGNKEVASFGMLNDMPASFNTRVIENFQDGEFRNIYRKSDSGSVRIIVKKDAPLFQGSKMAKRSCAVYISLIPKLKQIEHGQRQHFDSIMRRFAHNLVKFQTRFKGNFNRLISDSARSRPYNEFREEVKQRIESNTSVAADDVCQMSHRAVDLDAQIDTLRIISGYTDSSMPDTKINVDLQRTMYRIINPFIDEFKKKNIKINLDIDQAKSTKERVMIAPGLFNAAIWQLLDNASKYILEGTDVNISALLTSSPKVLEFEMISVCIDDDELEKIFYERYKGRHAGNKAEAGIGLFIVRKALCLMNAKIIAKNQEFIKESDGFKYCKNKFIIEFIS